MKVAHRWAGRYWPPTRSASTGHWRCAAATRPQSALYRDSGVRDAGRPRQRPSATLTWSALAARDVGSLALKSRTSRLMPHVVPGRLSTIVRLAAD
jgi:hypothetical protein